MKNIIQKQAVIIGAGPAGISCALVLKQAGIDFAIVDGSTPGGKINIAPRVDNYPGYKEIPGPDLAFVFYQRLIDNDISLQGENVVSLKKENNTFIVECEFNIYHCLSVLVASGTIEKKLGLPHEDELFGKGISYCALCDGHFFKNQNVVVVGGGNSALKEAIHLASIVKKLYVVHRRNEFRGNAKLVEELKSHPNVEILTPYIPIEIIGSDHLQGLIIQNKETNETKTLSVNGFFPLVGQNPNTSFVHIDGLLDEYRCVPVIDRSLKTKVDGLFAAGDVLPRDIKQIYLSEYDGKVAGKSIIAYLNAHQA